MSLIERMDQHLKDLKDPNSEASINLRKAVEKENIKEEILKNRLDKVEKYLSENNFEKIIKRLCDEHDDNYRDYCYKKGYEPYPNHKFSLLFEYIERNYSMINNNSIPQDFLSSLHFFKGYYFAVYCGQGCFYRIYDKNLETLLQV